jgi:glycosyltransferase involved in cell wall biosynthesis
MPERVAIVSSSFPPESTGGVSHAQYNLARALRAKGFTVRIFTFGDRLDAISDEDIVRRGVPPLVSRVLDRLIGSYFRWRDPSKIAYHFAEIAIFAWPCFKLNRPIRRFRPTVLILSDHGCPGFSIRRPERCKTILVSHHNPARFLGNPLWGLHSEHDVKLAVAAENTALQRVDGVICPSRYMHDMFRRTYAFSGMVTTIPNMIDLEMISSVAANDVREVLGLRRDAILIYIPSAGSIYKGSQFVCEIIRRLSSFSPEPIGFYLSGPITQSLRFELTAHPRNARIHAPGQVSYQDNLALVKSCSFGVSPTLIENFGMSILEAHACGVPMVSFDVGGNSDIVHQGRNGMLVPYLDIDGLVSAAGRLLDETNRAVMSRHAKEDAATRFGTEVVVEQLLSFMDKVRV